MRSCCVITELANSGSARARLPTQAFSIDEMERREWEKRSQAKQSIKRKAKQEEQERRLRTTAGADDADKARMATLKIDALKRVCAANMLLVSGNKSQLLERLGLL